MPRRTNRQRRTKRRSRATAVNNGRTSAGPPIMRGEMPLRPRSDPPMVLTRPWNTLVVQWEAPLEGPTEFTATTLYTQLATQLGTETTPLGIQIRILSIRVWNQSTKDTKLTLIPFRYHREASESGSQTGEFQSIVDLPAKNHWAKVGFRWPDSMSQEPIIVDGDVPVDDRSIFAIGDAGNYIIHLHVLWKFDQRGFNRTKYKVYRPIEPMEVDD